MSGSAVPTVYLHGFSGRGDGLAPFATYFSAGQPTICIDMPGFGGTSVPDDAQKSMHIYSSYVWQQIRERVPTGPVRLVGHSHGSMVGLILACEHPDEITQLDLFCPVAEPRFLPYLFIYSTQFLHSMRVPMTSIIWLYRRQFIVDIVTNYSLQPRWSRETRSRIKQLRRGESKFYSPTTYGLMHQTLTFTKVMVDKRTAVPTRICYMSDDNVASPGDYQWYQQHANVTKTVRMTGGHLGILAEPERVAGAFE